MADPPAESPSTIIYDIGEIDNINDKNQFKKLRAETDSEALKKRFSNKKLLDKNNPQNPSCRTLYQLAEKVRYELLGSEMLKGISKNFKDNYKNRLQVYSFFTNKINLNY